MSLVPRARAGWSSVPRVRAAIVRSSRSRVFALAILGTASACGGASAPDASAEVLERLDRIDTRLSAIENDVREDRTQAERPSADHDAGTEHRPPAPAGELADPFARDTPTADAGESLALAVTRTGVRVDGETVDDDRLRELLKGVGSVTVRTDDGVPQSDVVRLLDLLREADIRRVAIARLSEKGVTSTNAEP